jgi:hypothetical protein
LLHFSFLIHFSDLSDNSLCYSFFTGYELYYIPANKEIEIDEFDSLHHWTKVPIDSGASVSHVLQNQLDPNTEYVFKIRAIYPKGPGVFSEPCISKTLPEGYLDTLY